LILITLLGVQKFAARIQILADKVEKIKYELSVNEFYYGHREQDGVAQRQRQSNQKIIVFQLRTVQSLVFRSNIHNDWLDGTKIHYFLFWKRIVLNSLFFCLPQANTRPN